MTLSFNNSFDLTKGYSSGGGGEINNQNKTITTNGEYTADTGYTGLGTVSVNVDTVNNTTLTVTPTTSQQSLTPSSPYTGYGSVSVNAVTSSIDNNITAGNIKKDVTILGVTGNLETGITPTGTISISQNGTVDVTNYASANVNVSGGGGGSSSAFSPTNTAGLCFWIDGDCNTRNGLDRTALYMEDLVWSKPPTQSTGNKEYFINISGNSWDGNFLEFNGTGATLYPTIGTTESFTCEVVYKVTNDILTASPETVFIAVDDVGNNRGFSILHNSSNPYGTYFWSPASKNTIQNTPTLTVGNAYYIVFRINGKSVSFRTYPAAAKTKTIAEYFRYLDINWNTGVGILNTNSTTTFTPRSQGLKIGMIRYWSRALSDAEIAANYQDAQTRFGCQ